MDCDLAGQRTTHSSAQLPPPTNDTTDMTVRMVLSGGSVLHIITKGITASVPDVKLSTARVNPVMRRAWR